jgi:rhomboid family GlyGly-CTERM serine protease
VSSKPITRRVYVSSAEVMALVIAVATLALLVLAPAELLEYRRTSIDAEPWRLFTGHLVHVNAMHAVVNALALVIVARLFAPDLSALRQAGVLLAAAGLIGAGLAVFYPAVSWYRGLSGIVHALFFAGAAAWLVGVRAPSVRTLWLPAALLVGGWIKVIVEQPTGDALPHADWLNAAVVPQAHLLGAACGTAFGLLVALADRRGREKRDEQQQLQRR